MDQLYDPFDTFLRSVVQLLDERPKAALGALDEALEGDPWQPDMLLLAAVASLRLEQPRWAERHLTRFAKRYVKEQVFHLLRAIGLSQQGRWQPAYRELSEHGLLGGTVTLELPLGPETLAWVNERGTEISYREALRKREGSRLDAAGQRAARRPGASSPTPPGRASGAVRKTSARTDRAAIQPATTQPPAPSQPAPVLAPPPPPPLLPVLSAKVQVRIEPPTADVVLACLAAADAPADGSAWLSLRHEHAELGLFEEFDELLCLPALHGVEIYWYQVETARKVLRQFHGRVLLADEVGLGKTIEAGMVVKEYRLRGMASRILILVPPSLVGQWQEEMESKFDLTFATSQDALARRDPEAFWAQPLVIASIAWARRAEQRARATDATWDVVVVDEAHHARSRTTANWKLVDALRKRFLLLLSATPVQNDLVELYNLLTLLKPGIFQTERDFRTRYMVAGSPRRPANRDQLHELMRDVMIRNTRAVVDLKLPPRRAATLRPTPSVEERACYEELVGLVAAAHRAGPGRGRLALRHLLTAAGSGPQAAAAAIARFAARPSIEPDDAEAGAEGAGAGAAERAAWLALAERYGQLPGGAKEAALMELLAANPGEKLIVFAHSRDTLDRLAALLTIAEITHVSFRGDLGAAEKDAAVERFRGDARVLLASESGGEGRNLQFCHTLVNYDLPWNPMAIEQRIGRLHRIGQTREVFVFNLATRGTLEDELLALLDEKIHMFELVVGEIGAILGELDEEQGFSEAVFDAWVGATEDSRSTAFAALGERVALAQREYEAAKRLDDELFADELATA